MPVEQPQMQYPTVPDPPSRILTQQQYDALAAWDEQYTPPTAEQMEAVVAELTDFVATTWPRHAPRPARTYGLRPMTMAVRRPVRRTHHVLAHSDDDSAPLVTT